ncbi:hypothetical protein ACWDYJ_30790 [Streptomyces sp. NPDC003042]
MRATMCVAVTPASADGAIGVASPAGPAGPGPQRPVGSGGPVEQGVDLAGGRRGVHGRGGVADHPGRRPCRRTAAALRAPTVATTSAPAYVASWVAKPPTPPPRVLLPPDAEPVPLGVGDVPFLPHGSGLSLADRPGTQAAGRVGYAFEFAFAHAFERAYGTAPGAYRRRASGSSGSSAP